jgi:hypothetical protein
MVVRELLNEPLDKQKTFPFGRADVMLSSEAGKGLDTEARLRLKEIISRDKLLTESASLISSQVTFDRVRCINHWAELLKKLEELDMQGANPSWRETMPSFPIWGFELDPWQWYPIHENPKDFTRDLVTLADMRQEIFKSARKQIFESTSRGVDINDYAPAGVGELEYGAPLFLIEMEALVNLKTGTTARKDCLSIAKQLRPFYVDGRTSAQRLQYVSTRQSDKSLGRGLELLADFLEPRWPPAGPPRPANWATHPSRALPTIGEPPRA